ncbi:MAG: leucine-rich repeat domain-containing protein, partial [Lachnospiraceae bacterium]|nr:leucine-rich repeat domain-containing protein [Lachnospiraceae bacterium]
ATWVIEKMNLSDYTLVWEGTRSYTYNGKEQKPEYKLDIPGGIADLLNVTYTGDTKGTQVGTYNLHAAVSPKNPANFKGTPEFDANVTWEITKCAHTKTHVTDKKDATKDAEGYTGDVVCDDCGTVVTKGTVIAKLDNGSSQQGTGNGSGAQQGGTQDPGKTEDKPVVKEGDIVNEAGKSATYKIISATDKMVAFTGDPKASGTVKIPATITVGGVTYQVTAIADKAFKGNKKIKKVTIPNTVVSIGKSAFENCTALTTLTIKGTKLASIGQSAFKNCKALKKVTFPKNVKSVGKQAFSGCKKLKTIVVKNKKTKFAAKSFASVPKTAKMKLPKMSAKEKTAFKKMMKTAKYKGKYK